MRSTWLAIVQLVKRSRFSFLVFWSTYVPYRRKKLTFAISSPDEFLLYICDRIYRQESLFWNDQLTDESKQPKELWNGAQTLIGKSKRSDVPRNSLILLPIKQRVDFKVCDITYCCTRSFCHLIKMFITVCTVVQDCCKGRSNKYRKWHFWGSCRPETP